MAVTETLGKLDITGTTGITAGTNTGHSSFTDTDATNEFGGTVTIVAGATTIVNDSALALQGSVTGNLVVTSGGAISDSAALAVSGTSSFTDSTNAGITLDTLQSDGAVTVSGGTTTIDNDSALALQGSVTGNLVVTSGGAISDSAAPCISGTSSFTDSANAGITLDSLQSDGAVTWIWWNHHD